MKTEGIAKNQVPRTELEKDEEINNIIKFIIDKGVENKEDLVKRFSTVYQNNYRHKYSEILKLLMGMQDEPLDYLVLNMNDLKKYISNSKYIFEKSFLKLYDHIMLEVTRIRLYHDYEKRENEIEDKINNAKKQLEDYKKMGEDLNRQINNANKQINNSNAQFISILGIFSGVVIAFFGSIKVSENIFSNLENNIKEYRIIFMGALVGFILFNTIFLLMYLVAKICDKNIATNDLKRKFNKCYGQSEKKIENKYIKKYTKILDSPFRRLKIRYPVVFWFNFFMIVLMFIAVVLAILKI